MKWALVGNNDGPLYVLRSLEESLRPVFIGLQKPVDASLKEEYIRHSSVTLAEGFEEKELLPLLEKAGVEMVLNVYCNFRFRELLKRYKVLNVHPSPLPRYRGRHPLHWALINGETSFAISIHEMAASFDAGPILWQKEVPIKKGMSVAELRTSLMNELEQGFPAFFSDFLHGRLKPKPNRDEEATHVLRRFPEDSCLREWSDSAKLIRTVMALRSEPNPAYLLINGRPITVRNAVLGDRKFVGVVVPQVIRVNSSGFEIACLDGNSIFFSELDPGGTPIQLNERITLL